MKKMDTVLTLRLPGEDIDVINQFAEEYHKDKSTTVRELVEMGRVYAAIKQYAEGKISLGKAAKIAGLTIVEMMDLLTELGIKNKLDIEDYLEGKKTVAKLF